MPASRQKMMTMRTTAQLAQTRASRLEDLLRIDFAPSTGFLRVMPDSRQPEILWISLCDEEGICEPVVSTQSDGLQLPETIDCLRTVMSERLNHQVLSTELYGPAGM